MDFSRNRVIIIVLLAITSIAIIIWGDYQSEAKRIKYFENFNLYLKGEILELENTNSGSFKIIGIRVDSSNYEFMFPKESEDVFFIIKNKKVAVLFDNGDLTDLSDYEIGDLIEIDSTKLSLSDRMNKYKFTKEGLRLTEKYFFPRKEIEIMFHRLNEL